MGASARLVPRDLNLMKPGEHPLGIAPADGQHERVDIARGLGAVIQVIGVLVHIEREDRRAAGQRMAVVGCPLIDEPSVARRPRQQHPAGTAAERLAHRDEFRAPALVGAEVARQGFPRTVPGSLCSPSPSKNSSCRIIEFIAMSCSRLRPLIRNPGALA